MEALFIWILAPTVAIIFGGTVAILRQPGAGIRSLILHFAAGVVFSVVAVELLPDIIKRHAPIEIIVGFTAGVATMLFLRVLTRQSEERQVQSVARLPAGLLFGVAIDIGVDGMLLGIGFSSGSSVGTMLTIALSVELLALGLATSASLLTQGFSKKKIILVNLGLASLFALTSIFGITVLRYVSGNNLEIVLSFGLAALLFLVTEELLVEAHEEKETPMHTACFFLGFLVLLILDLLGK